MASTKAISVMASTLPAGYIDLASAVQMPPQTLVSVIGYVSDFLVPCMTKGTDYQVKFVLKDKSFSLKGLEVKCFRRHPNELPLIGSVGDVVLLRFFRLQMHNGILSGLSTAKTQHVVFSKDSIVTPDFRTNFQVHGKYMPHTKSLGADQPTIHEQQWVITLYEYYRMHHPPPAFAPTGPVVSRPSNQLPIHAPTLVVENDKKSARDGTIEINQAPVYQGYTSKVADCEPKAPPREKLSRMCDISIDKDSKGSFCDLVGEVVKLYSNDQGYLDLYLTDYTSNELLTNYEYDPSNAFSAKTWAGPLGKRTLQIELYAPHGPWALQNVNPGDLLYLKNVRIKYNNRGNVIGNMWPDRNTDKINVSLLSMNNRKATELIARKKAYLEQQESDILFKTGDNVSKRQRKKLLQEKKLQEKMLQEQQQAGEKNWKKSKNKKRKRGQEEKVNTHNLSGDDNSIDMDMDIEHEPGPTVKKVKHIDTVNVTSRYIVNENILCNHPATPLSSFEEIINNPNRWYTSPNGVKFEMEFVNAKHRARFRVVDYYPHNLRDFSQAVPSTSNPNHISWEWNFWLVLRGGNVNEEGMSSINCSVKGLDAEVLVGRDIRPQDFSRATAERVLKQLEERLFYLWGELKERKDKFLHGHPHIKPDDEFSATKYNITSDSLPFEACIAEYGVEIPQLDGNSSTSYEEQWRRMYKMCNTEING